MDRSIAHVLERAAIQHGEHLALAIGCDRFSYRQLNELANRFANALERVGVAPGHRVSLYAPNSWQWIVSYYAVLKLGAVVNPLNAMLTAEEAKYAIEDCGASLVVASADNALALVESVGSATNLQVVSFGPALPGALGFDAMIDRESAHFTIPAISPDALSTIAYTSGTTGHPKGAMLSHKAVLLNAAMTSVMHTRHAGDVVVTALPCAHAYGNIVMNATFACGGTLVLHPTFAEHAVLESIEQFGATLFEGVPTMYMSLLDVPQLKRYKLGSLQRCTVGGQTMPTAKIEQVEQAFGCPLIELWGMTELAGPATTQTLYGPRKRGSIGIPLPHVQARINVMPNCFASTLHPGIGELMIRGGLTMMGYYNNEDATAEVLTEDGWLRTGDLGHMDEDGFIFLIDRAKDLIVTDGCHIYPAEIERVIAGHPAVAMVAVGTVKDAEKGELAKAYIVLAKGRTASEAEIIAYCQARLARDRLPRLVQFMADLPKTSTGKIMRRALEEAARQELAASP
ncbi:class I adenylate-forming enzyme family protein [Massilia consociata]|uniref:Class I adenylate-forming enzyme family protein n=1 Tax=Massilia consociata TaxID=760117 RepID=A0ABV6FH56_9BURK